jgi:citrate synthase
MQKNRFFQLSYMSKERTRRTSAASEPALPLDRAPLVRDSSAGTGLKHQNQEDCMSNEKKIVTGLGKPELHRVLIRGYDLTKDLVGKITFSDMTYLMLVGRFPNDGERRMTDALLTILVEHGMVSSVVSARLC